MLAFFVHLAGGLRLNVQGGTMVEIVLTISFKTILSPVSAYF